MQDATQAYRKVATQISSPRELEAILLQRSASQLQAVRDNWNNNRDALQDALFNNRQLWLVFLTSVTRAENPLPVEIRQNVANLGLFVLNHTLTMMTDPRQEQLDSLISINREVAAGLLARSQQPTPETTPARPGVP